jgi:hypothetical protein
VATGPENRRQTVETVSIPTPNGTFQPERRDETIVTVQGNQTVTNTATYQPDPNQRLALSQQTVETATKGPKGAIVTETNIYGTAMAGRVYSPGMPLQIVEQRLVTQTVGADGSVTETLQTRQPSLADPNRLSAPQFVAETVCVGQCLPPEEEAPVQVAKADDAKAKAKQKGKEQPVEQAAAPATEPSEPKPTAPAKTAAAAPPATAASKGKAPAPAKPPTPAELNPPMPPPRQGDAPLR